MILARVYNDFELASRRYVSRTADEHWTGLPSTPQTVPMETGTRRDGHVVLHGKETVRLSPGYIDLLKRINSDKAYHYLLIPKAGWMIHGYPKCETLAFGDNLVEVIEIVGTYAQIKTFDANKYNDLPYNATDYPELIHEFTVITRKSTLIKPGNGFTVYIFLIATQPVYIHISNLDFNDLKPKRFTQPVGAYYHVSRWPFAKAYQRNTYNSPMNYRLLVGTKIFIDEVSNGFGRIPRKGWIALSDVTKDFV